MRVRVGVRDRVTSQHLTISPYVSIRVSASPHSSLYLPYISGEHEVCRWSLAGSNDGNEWAELHAGTWGLQQDSFYSSPVSGVCTAHRYFRFKTLGSAAAGWLGFGVSLRLG